MTRGRREREEAALQRESPRRGVQLVAHLASLRLSKNDGRASGPLLSGAGAALVGVGRRVVAVLGGAAVAGRLVRRARRRMSRLCRGVPAHAERVQRVAAGPARRAQPAAAGGDASLRGHELRHALARTERRLRLRRAVERLRSLVRVRRRCSGGTAPSCSGLLPPRARRASIAIVAYVLGRAVASPHGTRAPELDGRVSLRSIAGLPTMVQITVPPRRACSSSARACSAAASASAGAPAAAARCSR